MQINKSAFYCCIFSIIHGRGVSEGDKLLTPRCLSYQITCLMRPATPSCAVPTEATMEAEVAEAIEDEAEAAEADCGEPQPDEEPTDCKGRGSGRARDTVRRSEASATRRARQSAARWSVGRCVHHRAAPAAAATSTYLNPAPRFECPLRCCTAGPHDPLRRQPLHHRLGCPHPCPHHDGLQSACCRCRMRPLRMSSLPHQVTAGQAQLPLLPLSLLSQPSAACTASCGRPPPCSNAPAGAPAGVAGLKSKRQCSQDLTLQRTKTQDLERQVKPCEGPWHAHLAAVHH